MEPPRLPPRLPAPPQLPAYQEPWVISQVGRDRLQVMVDGAYNRQEVFRLIGQLERAASAM